MRLKFVTVAIATGVLLIASCKWFGSAQQDKAFNIEGKWLIDSINLGKDSSSAFALLGMADFKKDSIKRGIEFKPDSMYAEIPASAAGKGTYYLKEHDLFIEEDSSFVPYNLNIVNDSLVHLSSGDSAYVVLKRQ